MNSFYCRNVALAALLLASGLTQASVSLGFGPAARNGNVIEIAVAVSGLGEASASALSTYDLLISFDFGQLAFTGVQFGDPLLGDQLDVFGSGGNAAVAELTEPGLLNLFELSYDTAEDLNGWQTESFTLATLNFDIIKPGSSLLGIGINVFDDGYAVAISPEVVSATLTTVPLPSAMWLMISALGLIYRSRGPSAYIVSGCWRKSL